MYAIIKGLKSVFSEIRYVFVAFLIALVFYVLNVIIGNIRNLRTAYDVTGFQGMTKMLGVFVVSFADTMPRFMYANMILISLLTGILVTLLVYRYRIINSTMPTTLGFSGGLGLFFGVLAPGCASCGLGLIALLGLSSSLIFLPFRGNELSFLALGLLTFSVLSVSNNLGKGIVCKFTSPAYIHERRLKRNGKRKQ